MTVPDAWDEWAAQYPATTTGPLDTIRVCRDREEAEDLVSYVKSRGAEAHLLHRTITAGEWVSEL